jgi:hypothetical protein
MERKTLINLRKVPTMVILKSNQKKGNIMRIASITKILTKRERPGASRLVHKKTMAGDSK